MWREQCKVIYDKLSEFKSNIQIKNWSSNYPSISVFILGRFKIPTLQVGLINLCLLYSKQRYNLIYIIFQCLFQN